LYVLLRLASNLTVHPTTVRVLVEFRDVRVLAFGVLNNPSTSFYRNHNAHVLMCPPGIALPKENLTQQGLALSYQQPDISVPLILVRKFPLEIQSSLPVLVHPAPAAPFACYPYPTPGSMEDLRFDNNLSEIGRGWVGPVLLVAQLIGPVTKHPLTFVEGPPFDGAELVLGSGRGQYASFDWEDLMTIAPWMREAIPRVIGGPGLGLGF
jgi:hypothetical protein